MDVRQARERAGAAEDLRAFIRLSDETDGTISLAVKDVIDVAGLPTTAGSPFPHDGPAERDAPVVAALRRAGAGVVGKTNLHEWAIGVTSDNRTFGRVVNPVAPDRLPGGSSGGSAVAVAAGLADWALGTDTGGSNRIPAALCGVAGFKPTLGLLPTDGIRPVSTTLDTVGPLGRDVAAVASAFAAMNGTTGGRAPRDGYRLGIPRGWVRDLDPDTASVWRTVSAGVEEIDFPEDVPITAAALTVLRHEAYRYHRERLAEAPHLFDPGVRDVLLAGQDVTGDEYAAARSYLAGAADHADAACAGVDAILLPTCPVVAPPRGASNPGPVLTRFTRPFNGTGQPAISVPGPSAGLPVGIQIVGPRGGDAHLLDVAAWCERRWRDTVRS